MPQNDYKMSEARKRLDWEEMFKLSMILRADATAQRPKPEKEDNLQYVRKLVP